MASLAAKVARRAAAEQELAQNVAELVEVLGIEPPAPAGPNRDPELARIIEIERSNALLGSIVTAVRPLAEAAAEATRQLAETASETPEIPDDLESLTRKELNEIAAALSIENAEGLGNKEAVIAAIRAIAPTKDGEE